ncbi:hypothetical protein H9P43_007767 [Blastocladiella emersonii ATCC 22665]|nr:hypothetical protein H9P43_007767 [Blastocladiella emersonii ATCC 22665]
MKPKSCSDLSQTVILPYELIEECLSQLVLLDPRGTDPLTLLHVLPGLKQLRNVILRHSLHDRIQSALDSKYSALRDLLIESWDWSQSDLREQQHPAVIAATHGHAHVLAWLLQHGLMTEYAERTASQPHLADVASAHGHVDVFDWLVENELITDAYTERAIGDAVRAGHNHVLTWWYDSQQLLVKVADDAFDDAMSRDNPFAVFWLCDAGLHDYEFGIPKLALEAGTQIEFWARALDTAIELDDDGAVLSWFFNTMPKTNFSSNSDGNSAGQASDEQKPTFWAEVIKRASRSNDVAALSWLLETLTEQGFVRPQEWAEVAPSDSQDAVIDRLDWWRDSGLSLPYDHTLIHAALNQAYGPSVAKWWQKHVREAAFARDLDRLVVKFPDLTV